VRRERAGEKAPGGYVIRGPVDRLDSNQVCVPEAEHGEAAGFDASQNNRLIKALNKAHHLKLQIALICPEPWNGSVEMRRFSSETRRNGARLIRRVLWTPVELLHLLPGSGIARSLQWPRWPDRKSQDVHRP
jgi:hypothetical protein